MRYDATSRLTTYNISHKHGDSSIKVLRDILDPRRQYRPLNSKAGIFLDDPFDLAVTISTLSFEASKYRYHVK